MDEHIPENRLFPHHVFRFHVDFMESKAGTNVPLCSGAFQECTGLEATMEPKVIKAGGRNYGPAQRAGPVTFGTVILKRGMTTTRDLWRWFFMVTGEHKYAYRLSVTIKLQNHAAKPIMSFTLDRALPVKFKTADLKGTSTELGIEEIHLAHEGLTIQNL
jgi:phage tail-like protein